MKYLLSVVAVCLMAVTSALADTRPNTTPPPMPQAPALETEHAAKDSRHYYGSCGVHIAILLTASPMSAVNELYLYEQVMKEECNTGALIPKDDVSRYMRCTILDMQRGSLQYANRKEGVSSSEVSTESLARYRLISMKKKLLGCF